MLSFEWDENKNKANLLIVCHCCREEESIIRIISARKATRTESTYYG